jgi:rhodanese-related sulfurtransferase
LTKLGFKEVYALRGGLRAWTEAGLPLEKGS